MRPSRWGGWALGLAAFGLVERLGLWLVYQPATYGDTGSYMRLAGVLVKGTLDGYDGTRTPGYPAFLAMVGLNPERAWLAQMGLGLAISLLLFWLTWRTTRSPILAAGVGVLYDLIPGQVLFEANLLTETLTTFGIVMGLALLPEVEGLRRLPWRMLAALTLGAAASVAALARPLFYVLPAWLLPFVIGVAGPRWGRRLAITASFALIPAVALGGWLVYIDRSYHMLSPTTMVGYSLVQHTGAFFEYLPDEDAAIRDTYLKYRNARLAERGNQTNTIWDAIPELTQVSGLTFYDLSRQLQRLSLMLIREHPILYLKSVAQGWIDFWKAPVYWQPDLLRMPGLRPAVNAWAQAGRLISVAGNLLFLGISASLLVGRRIRYRFGVDVHWVAAAGLVWVSSVAQTLLDHGDNPRFLVPLQMVVLYIGARSVWSWQRTRKRASG